MNAAPEWFVTGIMGRLAAAYPSWQCHGGTIQVFWDSLHDMPRNELERATIAHVSQEVSWPIVAKLRALAKMNHDDDTLTASEAWEEMYRFRHAHARNPSWSSQAVERAAEAVRWNDPDWRSDQIPTIRAQFERYYNSIEAKLKRNELLLESEMLTRRAGLGLSLPEPYGSLGTDDDVRPSDRPYDKPDDVDPPQIDDIDD